MPQRHLRLSHVCETTGLSKSTIYLMMSRGQFPRPIKLTNKAVGWPESVVAEWLESREVAS